jgi:PTS system nitrogen regulatory IIA component
MLDLDDLIAPDAVLADLAVANKKTLFGALGVAAARAYGVDAALATDRLSERERLGSTGFGNGVAIPHGKIDGLTRVVGVVARLSTPIDFGAVDDMPVDLVVMLLSPVDAGAEHLKALARVSRALRDVPFVAKLRGAASADALTALFAGSEARDAA